jgi:hypothetical protein
MILDADISGAIPESLLTVLENLDLVEVVLDDIASSAHAKWIRLAQTDLKTSRQSYIEGIQEVESQPGQRTIALVGWLANAVENGLDPFDLRETLLGPNAKNRHPILASVVRGLPKVRTGGWYANVPFRHGTPGSTGLAGQPMGSPYGPRGDMSRAAGGVMTAGQATAFGQAVYAAAKALQTKTASRKGATLPSSQGGPLLRPHHTTGIYTGMSRTRKPYVNVQTGKTTTQPQYGTFRRISTSNPSGWLHPGIEPHGFAEQVNQHVERIAPTVIAQAIKAALDGKAA